MTGIKLQTFCLAVKMLESQAITPIMTTPLKGINIAVSSSFWYKLYLVHTIRGGNLS